MSNDLGTALERNIPLYEMLQTLRHELKASVEAAEGETMRFELDMVELELRVGVKRDTSAEGKIQFWVFEAGATRGSGTEQTHIFRLKLKPTDPFLLGH